MSQTPKSADFITTEKGIRLLSCDLDGTVIFEGFPSAEDSEALEAWRAAGNVAVCNSGRSVEAAKFVLNRCGLKFDYYVLYSGAAVFNADWEPLTHTPLPADVGYEIADWLMPNPAVTVFATTLRERDFMLSMEGKIPSYTGKVTVDARTRDYHEIKGEELMGMPVYVAGDDATVNGVQSEILARFGERVDAHRNVSFIDIAPKGCDKATGLQWLLEYLQGEESIGPIVATHSLGDSWNDLPMHEFVRYSCSFEHSPADIKESTTHVTPSAAEYIHAVLQGV
ncbi:MAG: HAD family hydrolase [Corynebacterium sp.]|nr:HAD family hydrolase [Corynebacterium sp.]